MDRPVIWIFGFGIISSFTKKVALWEFKNFKLRTQDDGIFAKF